MLTLTDAVAAGGGVLLALFLLPQTAIVMTATGVMIAAVTFCHDLMLLMV